MTAAENRTNWIRYLLVAVYLILSTTVNCEDVLLGRDIEEKQIVGAENSLPMVPPIILITPFFIILRFVHMLDSMLGLAASAVFIFLQAWNEFLFAVILTRTTVSQTLPVAESFFVREGMSQRGMNVGAIAVVGTIAVIPMIMFVSLVQEVVDPRADLWSGERLTGWWG